MVGCDQKYSGEIGQIISNIQIDVMVNDECDICVKITKKNRSLKILFED